MQRGQSTVLFMLFVAAAAAFVWFTGRALPEVVASHFDASGSANGFMPHDFYLGFMLVLIVGIPLLMAVVMYFVLGNENTRLNLPHKEYWLAPERRTQSVAFLRAHAAWFAISLAVFLCYVHWLVVAANQAQPAHLSTPWLVGGVVGFLVAGIVWVAALFYRFSIRGIVKEHR